MKRYRVLSFQFDTRANILKTEIQDDWDEQVKETWGDNKAQIESDLIAQYGAHNAELKLRNLIDLGALPISVLAFHNVFLPQVRSAFIVGGYYPALTGVCALGERILNHLMLRLRDYFKATPEYKQVYRKNSFDKWGLAIDSLESWDVLLSDVVSDFRKLETARHQAIHFNPETDRNDRTLALKAIELLQGIVQRQFGVIGSQPWFISEIGGAAFIKSDYEDDPFVKEIYLPNCALVGPNHSLDYMDGNWVVAQDGPYENDNEISDEEFRERYNSTSSDVSA